MYTNNINNNNNDDGNNHIDNVYLTTMLLLLAVPRTLATYVLGGATCRNNTCLIRPRLCYACFVVSRIIIRCQISRHC